MWEYAGLFDRIPDREPMLWESVPTSITVGRMGYRTRTTKAGPRLECEIYPIWARSQKVRARAARENLTPEAMKRLNDERGRRYLVQLADANFGENDIHLTLTYAGNAPDYAQAQKDVRNFIAKLKRRREKMGLSELKYIYTIESDEEGQKNRTHIHMLTSGGMDRSEVEKIWRKGYANADRLQPTENGLEAIARYLIKQQRNRRRWSASKNLKKPSVRTSDTKASNAKVRRAASGFENEARTVMEKMYPGYRFVSASVRYSDVVEGVYLYAVMRKERSKRE